MKKNKSSNASLGDVAKAAGISKPSASFALRNKPGVSKATRERVLRIAKRLGYVPDARLSSWMTKVQDVTSKDLLPIAWLNTSSEIDAWHKYKFHTPYLEGARERALELGYRLDEIWAHEPGMTMRRISQILFQRGIEGVIVTYPAKHIRLNWDHLACVVIGGDTIVPPLDRVLQNHINNFWSALKMLRRNGYRRIGVCLDEYVGRSLQYRLGSTQFRALVTPPKSDWIPPLIYKIDDGPRKLRVEKQLAVWACRHRPDVILGHDNRLVGWVEKAGYRVPADVGVAHLATDDDVPDWAGICANKRAIGATAAERVIFLAQNHMFGVPKIAVNMLIGGSWRNGRTLRPAKPE